MNTLKGVFPALLTPFDKNNKINDKALQKLIKMNLDKGVNGFYVGGSTSEVFLLSMDERKYILDIVAQEVKGKCAIICHVGSVSTGQAIELGKYAEKVGVDAISTVAPFYYNFSVEEIKSYFYDVVENVNLPMIIYNIPHLTKVTFDLETISEFMKDDRFIGVKHTSTDFFGLERIKQMKENVIVYNGFDQMFLAGLIMGADGGIGTSYNVLAEKFVQIKKLFDSGQIKEAQSLQTSVNNILSVVSKIGSIPAWKEMLNQMGLEFGKARKPFKKITEEEKDILRTLRQNL